MITRLFAAIILPLASLALAAVPSCSTNSPQIQAAEKASAQIAEQIVLNSAQAAVLELTNTGHLSGKAEAAGALNGAAIGVRSLEGSDLNPSAATVRDTIAVITGNPQLADSLAPAVSSTLATAASRGITPDLALEAAAKSLDKVAAKIAPSHP